MTSTLLFVGNHLSQSAKNMGVGEELAFHLEQDGYHTLLVSRKLNKPARLFDMLSTILHKRRLYDIAEVDVFSGPAFLWAFLSAGLLKLLGKPLILSLHGGNLPNYAVNNPQRVKRLLSWADAVVAPSAYLKHELSPYREEICLIPNGLEVIKYPFQLRAMPRPMLVWLRAFHQIYNPSLAPKVIRLLKDQHIDAHLFMVGPDKGDGSLQEMLNTAKEMEIADWIEVIRGVSKERVPEMLTRADIFLNTTNFESFGVSVMEAAACGLCIVTTNVGELSYLWEDGIDALLVPPNDPNAMASAVKRILTEPELAEKLSANARKKAEQFDWSKILPLWEKLISEMIEKEKE